MWPVAAGLLMGGMVMRFGRSRRRKRMGRPGPGQPGPGRPGRGRRVRRRPVLRPPVRRVRLRRVVEGEAGERKLVTFWKDVDLQQGLALVDSLGGRAIRHLPLINAVVCEFPRATAEFYRALALAPQIMDVEEDGLMHILCWWRRPSKPSPAPPQGQVLPWGIKRIGADQVWRKAQGRGVKVAVLDTGVNADHPDLKGAVVGGINVFDENAAPHDDNGHGTHVAGIIGARNNDIGVVGVAPEAEIYAVKAFDSRGSARISGIIAGVQWCVENGMQVINMSFGGTENRALGRALQAALDAGIVLVAAAGNDGQPNSVNFPASYPGVLAVSATTGDDKLASFSSRGPEVDLAAPGAKILSTYGDSYKELSGTSMATPHVTGVVALLLERYRHLSTSALVERLKRTCERLPSLDASEQGAGLVNAVSALGA